MNVYAGMAKYPDPVMWWKFQLFQDSGVLSALGWFVGATVQLLRGSFRRTKRFDSKLWPNHVGCRLQQMFCKNTPKSKTVLSNYCHFHQSWEFHRCFTKLCNCGNSSTYHMFSPSFQLFFELEKEAVDLQRTFFHFLWLRNIITHFVRSPKRTKLFFGTKHWWIFSASNSTEKTPRNPT